MQKLYGVIQDIHLPWCDLRALTLALEVMQDQNVECLIINGDLVDFYNLNAWGPKHIEVQSTLDDEIYSTLEFLDRVQKMFKEVIFIYGNHEFRLERFVIKHCPVFWNHLKLEKMLNLEARGIKHVPYNERYRLGESGLFVQHSPPSYSENAASTSLRKKIDQDHIWGCTHRTDKVVKTGSSGKIYTSYMNGWFGSVGVIKDLQSKMPENRRVFSFTKNHESWNRSFSIAGVCGKRHWVNQIVIKDYSCMVGGNLYEG